MGLASAALEFGAVQLKALRSALKLALGKVEGTDHRSRRLTAIVQGVVSGLAGRFLGVGIGFISVPLTIDYLGPERYGVWALVGSLLAWVRLADLGIGNGLTTSLSSAFGANDEHLMRVHVSTALAVLSAIAAVLGLVIALAWPFIDWTTLFGLKTELARVETGHALVAAVAIFLIGFPLSVISPAYAAMQEGKIGNYWGMGSSVASLSALLVVTHTRGGLLWLVLAVSGTGLVISILSGVWFFLYRRPSIAPRFGSLRRDSARGLFQTGMQFFLIQIMALVVFETDNLVIAHYLGAASVPPYSVTYTLFGFTSIVQTILFRYVWVAYAEAIARQDYRWVRKTFLVNLSFSMASTFVAVIPLIFLARPFIRVWAGDAVAPPFHLVLWMAAWTMINAFCSPIASILAATSHMKVQIVYSAVMAVANIMLSVNLVQSWGINGVIAATVISYLLFVCGPAAIDTALLFRRRLSAV